MNITSKLAALVVCCAGAVALAQPARADGFSIGYHSGGWGGWHRSGYSVSVGVGSGGYGGGYYAGPVYYPRPACYYDYYGYYRCPVYYGGYRGPVLRVGYWGGWRGGWYGGWRGGGWYRGGWHGGHGWGGYPSPRR